MSSAG